MYNQVIEIRKKLLENVNKYWSCFLLEASKLSAIREMSAAIPLKIRHQSQRFNTETSFTKVLFESSSLFYLFSVTSFNIQDISIANYCVKVIRHQGAVFLRKF